MYTMRTAAKWPAAGKGSALDVKVSIDWIQGNEAVVAVEAEGIDGEVHLYLQEGEWGTHGAPQDGVFSDSLTMRFTADELTEIAAEAEAVLL